MEQNNLKVTIEEARQWYESGNPELRKLALRAFSKKKLEDKEFPTAYDSCLAKVSEIATIEFVNRKVIAKKLSIDNNSIKTYIPKYAIEPLEALAKLLIYRDAWWKADNNYYPDFNYGVDKKYTIFMSGNQIVCDETCHQSRILAFSSKDIRDKFFKEFRYIINEAKTLL